MGAWGTSIFSDDMALDIRREYSILLSVGKENNEIEKMLKDYYSCVLNNGGPDEDVFWFVLALCEWKKGRLSSDVKAKALSALDGGRDLERWNTPGNKKNYEKRKRVLEELRAIILSPMPPAKAIRKPTVHHCPWKVGSLLAYRIIANKELLSNHPCYGKYVLLRVIKVDKHPVSKLFDTDYYDETMLVGLYGWIGDSIPNPEIVSSLEFIPIADYIPQMPNNEIDISLLNGLPEEPRKRVEQAIKAAFRRRIETCAQLDWLPIRNRTGDITYLDCDESFQEHIPDFFNTSITSYSMTGFFAFDITLAKRFENFPKIDVQGQENGSVSG